MNKFEDFMVDENIVKIAKSASSRFSNTLSKDEIYTCVLNAIWKASERHDPKLGSKFTTYLYNGVIMECLTQQKFNRNRSVAKLHDNIPETFNHADSIDLFDEIQGCDNPSIILDYFFNNKSIKEIAQEQGVSGETIRLKLKKNLEKLKTKLS
jgi:DNA-directed RNA polymerase specialized sigma subunit